jgi:PAS domain S-box-containing protein
LFGYSRKEVVGHDLDVIMSPDCSQNHRVAVDRYVRTRIPNRIGHGSEILATRKNGETFPAYISFSVTDFDGKLFFTGIVRDMTETRSLHEQIVKAERLAAFGQVVAEITHEIKNPLMMIGGFARQVIKRVEDEKSQEKLSIITEEVQRLEKLIADLREFYLPKPVPSQPVHIHELLHEIVALVQEDCDCREIGLTLLLDAKDAPVTGDADRLKQVFLNLMKNGIEAMESEGRIIVETRVSSDTLEVTVTDEGCGIPEKNRDRIFSPFFSTKKNGTGLGLCISKRIIEDHKGSLLSVASKSGKGTSFRVSLPLYGNNFSTSHES